MGSFFAHCWDIIADDMLQAIRDFMASVPIPKSISSSLIVWTPKKPNPLTFVDFRPISISLCTFVNKIFTKILANRLRPMLPCLFLKSNRPLWKEGISQKMFCLFKRWFHLLTREFEGIIAYLSWTWRRILIEYLGAYWNRSFRNLASKKGLLHLSLEIFLQDGFMF